MATSALLLVATSGLVGAPVAQAESEVELTITDPEITESSGLAADPNGGFYWTVNDSGDDARVFAVGPDGQTLGAVTFRADVTDVEALARTGDGLYVADIGDNEAERDFVTVYRLSQLTPGGTSVYSAWDLTYADGEARDAEAIAVTSGGDLLVITKEAEGGVWTTEEPLSADGTNTLQRIGDAPPFVTDATVLADGRIAVRSYLSVAVLDPVSFEVRASAALPLQPQGESLTTSLDGESLLVGSEGEGSEVLRVPVPDVLTQELPEDEAEPPSESSTGPSADPSAANPPADGENGDGENGDGDEADQQAAGSGAARQGTFLAVGLAALLALAAAAVVFLVGRGRPGGSAGGDDPSEDDPDPEVAQAAAVGEPEDTGPPTADPAGGAGSVGAGDQQDQGVPEEDTADEDTEGEGVKDQDEERRGTTDQDADGAAGAATDPEGLPAVDVAAARHESSEPPASSEEDGEFVRTEDGSGRVTWSEPDPDAAAAEPTDHAEDVDWLYEDRASR